MTRLTHDLSIISHDPHPDPRCGYPFTRLLTMRDGTRVMIHRCCAPAIGDGRYDSYWQVVHVSYPIEFHLLVNPHRVVGMYYSDD